MGSGNARREYFQSEYVPVLALIGMIKTAEYLGVEKGVAFILAQKKDDESGNVHFRVVNKKIIRLPRIDGSGDKGTNYFGVAMGKLAMMMATEQNSGPMGGSIPTGEMPYRGGLVKFEGRYRIFVGFSGGTEDQDVEIARTGMAMLFPK